MIKKISNRDKNFYKYMGKFFGSRIVERETNDRIYDDDKKEWYLYIERDIVLAFVSIEDDVIKNIYGYKEQHLEELLNYIKKDIKISNSILTKKYTDIYIKCGLQISNNQTYKNFVTICN